MRKPIVCISTDKEDNLQMGPPEHVVILVEYFKNKFLPSRKLYI